MRRLVIALLLSLIAASPAAALEMVAGFTWPDRLAGGDYNELVLRVGPSLPEPARHGSCRMQLAPPGTEAGRVDVVVSIRRESDRDLTSTPLATYEASIEIHDDGYGERWLPVFIPRTGCKVELAARLPGGQSVSQPLSGPTARHLSSGLKDRTLDVTRGGPSSGPIMPGLAKGIVRRPGELPLTETGYLPFERIRLWGVELSAFEPMALEALERWLRHGGELFFDRETVELAGNGAELDRLIPGGLIDRARSGARDVWIANAGLGRVVVEDGRRPAEGLARDFERIASTEPPDYSRRSRWEAVTYVPEGSSVVDRQGLYLLWLLPYGLAVAGLGVLLARRRTAAFARLLPPVCLGFCLLYTLLFFGSRSELEVSRVTVLEGQADDARLSAVRYTAVFSASSRRVEMHAAGPADLPPFELDGPNIGDSQPFELLDTLSIRRRPDGWQASFELMPAQVRIFADQPELEPAGTVAGSIRFEPGRARWLGRLESRLAFPLVEAHLVSGWHHQKLGALSPGQAVEVSMPLREMLREAHCRACGTHHPVHPEPCDSCGRVHPVKGALQNFIQGALPGAEMVHAVLQARAAAEPRLYSSPLLVGLLQPVELREDGQRVVSRTVLVIELPQEPLAGEATLPLGVAARQWEVNQYAENRQDRLPQAGCTYPELPRYRAWLGAPRPMRFRYPLAGPVSRIELAIGDESYQRNDRSRLVGFWDVEEGRIVEHMKRPDRPLVIEGDEAARFCDPTDGSIILSTPDMSGEFRGLRLDVRGGER